MSKDEDMLNISMNVTNYTDEMSEIYFKQEIYENISKVKSLKFDSINYNFSLRILKYYLQVKSPEDSLEELVYLANISDNMYEYNNEEFQKINVNAFELFDLLSKFYSSNLMVNGNLVLLNKELFQKKFQNLTKFSINLDSDYLEVIEIIQHLTNLQTLNLIFDHDETKILLEKKENLDDLFKLIGTVSTSLLLDFYSTINSDELSIINANYVNQLISFFKQTTNNSNFIKSNIKTLKIEDFEYTLDDSILFELFTDLLMNFTGEDLLIEFKNCSQNNLKEKIVMFDELFSNNKKILKFEFLTIVMNYKLSKNSNYMDFNTNVSFFEMNEYLADLYFSLLLRNPKIIINDLTVNNQIDFKKLFTSNFDNILSLKFDSISVDSIEEVVNLFDLSTNLKELIISHYFDEKNIYNIQLLKSISHLIYTKQDILTLELVDINLGNLDFKLLEVCCYLKRLKKLYICIRKKEPKLTIALTRLLLLSNSLEFLYIMNTNTKHSKYSEFIKSILNSPKLKNIRINSIMNFNDVVYLVQKRKLSRKDLKLNLWHKSSLLNEEEDDNKKEILKKVSKKVIFALN